jgi:hypothetical protein
MFFLVFLKNFNNLNFFVSWGLVKVLRCKNCLMPGNYPGVTLNSEGICSFCTKPSGLVPDEQRRRKLEFDTYVETIRGTKKYDCLLLLSGGKDSTYLLYVLKEKYKLNVLALSVDTGLLSPFARENIESAVRHFNVDHIWVVPENDFYRRFYQHMLSLHHEKSCCDTVCYNCQSLMHCIGLNEASRQEIPFVVLAAGPDQENAHLRYELSREQLATNWTPSFLYQPPFTAQDRTHFWNPTKDTYIPRFFLPFHFLEYPGQKKIIEMLAGMNLGRKKGFSPFVSNCALVWLMMREDLTKRHFNPYIRIVSKTIRQGNANRSVWYVLTTLGSWYFKSGFVKRKEIQRAKAYLKQNQPLTQSTGHQEQMVTPPTV